MDKIAIYQSDDGEIKISARVESDTIWLTQQQMAELFKTDRTTLNKHIKNIIKEGELDKESTCANFAQVQKEGSRNVSRKLIYYNLDMIISVGYRVKSKIATKFRKWATKTLKEYIVQGFAINESRIKQDISHMESLKKAVELVTRSLQHQIETIEDARSLSSFLNKFANGLQLLDDYDHAKLDSIGSTNRKAEFIDVEEFLNIISKMKNEFDSEVFGLPKDSSFESSIRQVYQSFGGVDCYSTIEEKAAMLLYLIIKNHSFIDGNKRIAAACFLYFLNKNSLLSNIDIDSNALFSLTILVASSRPNEMDIMKSIIVSILNRSQIIKLREVYEKD